MIERKDLGQLDRISEGGTGTVYRTPYRLSGYATPLAYKEFHTYSLSSANFKRVVDDSQWALHFRQSLSPDDQNRLDHFITWPLEMVVSESAVIGELMPLLPSGFFAEVRPPDHQQVMSIPRGMEWLSAKTNLALKSGFSQAEIDGFTDLVTRTAILAHLCHHIAWLHRHGLVYGDISLVNAVFSTNPPRIILLDGDSVCSLMDMSRQQLHSPQFCPPECLPVGSNPYARGNLLFQDTRTDVYKLALCVVRGLARGRGATHLTSADHLVGVLDNNSLQMIRQALSLNPDARPTAKDLYLALAGFVTSRIFPNERDLEP